MNAVTEKMPEPLVFTDAAAAKVKQLIDEEGNPNLKLRVFVQGGGCSGFQYGFTFDEDANDDDTRLREGRRHAADRPDEPAISCRRGNRLPAERRGRAVRDQEPERDFHLRLRVVVLGLDDSGLEAKAAAAAFFIALKPEINRQDAEAAKKFKNRMAG